MWKTFAYIKHTFSIQVMNDFGNSYAKVHLLLKIFRYKLRFKNFLNKYFIVGVVCELFILRVLINKQKYMYYIYHVL